MSVSPSNLEPQASTSEPAKSTKTPARHRITTTGDSVPAPITAFSELSERYSIPPLLLKNISAHGYEEPTGIQSQGIPILLEVCLTTIPEYTTSSLNTRKSVTRFGSSIAYWNRKDAFLPLTYIRPTFCSWHLPERRCCGIRKRREGSCFVPNARACRTNIQRVSKAGTREKMAVSLV